MVSLAWRKVYSEVWLCCFVVTEKRFVEKVLIGRRMKMKN